MLGWVLAIALKPLIAGAFFSFCGLLNWLATTYLPNGGLKRVLLADLDIVVPRLLGTDKSVPGRR